MERADLAELHFITPIGNLPSIMKQGIVCNRRSGALGAKSIAKPDVQALRAKKRVPGGLMIHEYANLYFNARNPMMYLRSALHEETCVLSIACDVLDLEGVVITDQNAASNWARFAAAPDGIYIVDATMTFAERWTHPGDQKLEWQHKSAMCAEVLVPNCIPPQHVRLAYVSSDAVAKKIGQLAPPLKVVLNPRLFFRQ